MRNFERLVGAESRAARGAAMKAYAEEMAGSSFDLDADLERAGVELLVKTGEGALVDGRAVGGQEASR